MNQQLAEEETARQGEARKCLHYRNMNKKLEKQLDNYKSVLSTLHEQEALTEDPSAHITDDPRLQDLEVKKENENEAHGLRRQRIDPLVLGPETVTYSARVSASRNGRKSISKNCSMFSNECKHDWMHRQHGIRDKEIKAVLCTHPQEL